MASNGRRADMKRSGREQARNWIHHPDTSDGLLVALAECDFAYGETLDDLIAEGYRVPRSNDRDFSLGFMKLVKGHVYVAVRRSRLSKTPEAKS